MKRIIKCIFVIGLCILTAWAMFHIGGFWKNRTHGIIYSQCCEFEESAKALFNPNRGLYTMFGMVVYDYEEDYSTFVMQRASKDYDNKLCLVQINLCRFSNGPITQIGLDNISNIFSALAEREKQYIIRFLYDWDGRGMDSEPKSLDIILTHMKQLEDVLRQHKDIIFALQGIFVGDCGEMHGSKYLSREDMRTLIQQLAEVSDEQTFLAVRTPAQWRRITQIADLSGSEFANSELASRLSLFNDGMMGTEQDTGTYGILDKAEVDPLDPWDRVSELEFQNELCKVVPNGGEVIIENPVNDFENAVESLATMHVTYLNRAYDANVLNKWAETIVEEEGCYNGMDGFTYIERHLGYRLMINNADFTYDFWKDTLSVDVDLQNVGFAPMYKKPDVYMVIHGEENDKTYTYRLPDDVRVLAGGNDKEDLLTIHKDIVMNGFEEGRYTVYFYMKDPDSGCHIQLANEQEETEWGYLIGALEVQSKEEWLDDLEVRSIDWQGVKGIFDK